MNGNEYLSPFPLYQHPRSFYSFSSTIISNERSIILGDDIYWKSNPRSIAYSFIGRYLLDFQYFIFSFTDINFQFIILPSTQYIFYDWDVMNDHVYIFSHHHSLIFFHHISGSWSIDDGRVIIYRGASLYVNHLVSPSSTHGDIQQEDHDYERNEHDDWQIW